MMQCSLLTILIFRNIMCILDDIASELKHMDITSKMLSEVKRRFGDRPVSFFCYLLSVDL